LYFRFYPFYFSPACHSYFFTLLSLSWSSLLTLTTISLELAYRLHVPYSPHYRE